MQNYYLFCLCRLVDDRGKFVKKLLKKLPKVKKDQNSYFHAFYGYSDKDSDSDSE